MLQRRSANTVSSSGSNGLHHDLEQQRPSSTAVIRETTAVVSTNHVVVPGLVRHENGTSSAVIDNDERARLIIGGLETEMRAGGVEASDDDHNNDDSSDEDQQRNHHLMMIENQKRRQQRRYEKWKSSYFAVGLTEPTWMAERTRDIHDRTLPPDDTGCLCCSAQICPLFGAQRVGNMAVLKQSMEWVDIVIAATDEDGNGTNGSMDETTTSASSIAHDSEDSVEHGSSKRAGGGVVTRRVARPRLDIVVGPYWPMLCGVTYPLILGVSAWTLYSGLLPQHHHHTSSTASKVSSSASKKAVEVVSSHGAPLLVWIVWIILTVGLIVSLALTAFRDPGILVRTRTLPTDPTWRWNDAADSYRPRHAWFDSDTAVIVEGFDHTCPWTGTAIGRKNMFSFQMFVCLVFLCMIMDIIILTGTFR